MLSDSLTVRRATAPDLAEINRIYYEEETRGEPDAPPYRALSYFAHLQEAGELWMAERAGTVIGFSGRLLRDGVSFLTDLFVDPAAQSGGVGAALLRAALPEDGTRRCTYASSDPRALALYARAGMQPRHPQCSLRARAAEMRPLDGLGVSLAAAEPGDQEVWRWDAVVGGRWRPREFAYWFGACAALPFWLRRGERTIGYAVIQQRSTGAVWYPESYTIGPVGVREREDAAAAVLAAVEWARTRAPVVRLFLPGPHAALAPLLEAGLRVQFVDTYCSSGSAPLFDPQRYVATPDLF